MPRIVTWNVNGVRSLPQSLPQILSSFDADVCCFQETKITRSALDTSIAFVDGFNSYFSFCRTREGYSGVVSYCKNSSAPVDAVEGLNLLQSCNGKSGINGTFDKNRLSNDDYLNDACCEFTLDEMRALNEEGRAVVTRHLLDITTASGSSSTENGAIQEDDFTAANVAGRSDCSTDNDVSRKYLSVINVYCPRLDAERPDRREFKRDFYRLLQFRAHQLLSSGDHVLIVGDLNCSHKRIDHCDPESDPEFDQNESRLWMDNFLLPSSCTGPDDLSVDSTDPRKFVDLFRWLYPQVTNAFTCWRHYGNARTANFGSRIDYVIGDHGLIQSNLLDDVRHLTHVHGSDHCPVELTLKNCRLVGSQILPSLCTKFMPEFKGEQQLINRFLIKRSPIDRAGCEQPKKPKTSSATALRPSKPSLTLKDYFSPKPVNSEKDLEEFSFSFPVKECSDCVPERSSSLPAPSTGNVSRNGNSDQWDTIFKKSTQAPLCRGHREPCLLRVSKKSGPNYNRRFYVCARPIGSKGDSNSNCDHFQWSR